MGSLSGFFVALRLRLLFWSMYVAAVHLLSLEQSDRTELSLVLFLSQFISFSLFLSFFLYVSACLTLLYLYLSLSLWLSCSEVLSRLLPVSFDTASNCFLVHLLFISFSRSFLFLGHHILKELSYIHVTRRKTRKLLLMVLNGH